MDVKQKSVSIGGKSISFETGKIAKLANGSIVARQGDTVVLATAVMGKQRDGMDYFPLLVDYEERLYAAGKIKGSRWVKREGRATDDAILKGRVIDRSIRPMFPDGMRNDVQVITTILSIDGVNEPDMLAVNAASMALTISDIPFDGPIAAVRVGKINGEFVLDPSSEQITQSEMDLIVSGTGEHIIMVEAGAKIVPEEDIIGGIDVALPHLKTLCDAQLAFRSEIGREKAVVSYGELDNEVYELVKKLATEEKMDAALFIKDKAEREAKMSEFQKEVVAQAVAALPDKDQGKVEKDAYATLDKLMKKYIQKNILEKERRVDGRKLDETRPVYCEVGILPRTHGSALFTRGETQVLSTVTLGSKGDEQLLDGMEDPEEGTAKRYIHHYNFPGYSVGEVSPLRGPGRREVGHGALAERALLPVIPPQEDFPYTMRLVSEAVASNGSTSMASTCGSTLALMDAGVKIGAMIGGVAMGLVLDEETGKYKVLTDIAGIEDFNGHMDFKVTGNENGITALQMDVKVKALTRDILADAIKQARPGRMHILSKMKEAISEPRADLSPYAPRITSFMIDPEKIREVIGSGGKVINGIIAETGVKIDIEDNGLVMVTSSDAEASIKAVDWIKNIARVIAPGETFDGKVTRLMNFGAFVELVPGQEGLVHISELANYRVATVEEVVKVGDPLKVQVKEIDDQGRINLTHRPFAKPAPEGARTEQSDRGGFRGNRGGGFRGGERRSDHGHGGHSGGGDRFHNHRSDAGHRPAPTHPHPEAPSAPEEKQF
jgi:polyribonucleotide nucleotidyltransferase